MKEQGVSEVAKKEESMFERVRRRENFNEKRNVILPNFSLSQKKKRKKKSSLTYYNRISKLTTILTYVLPRVNSLIINLHTICINYLEPKRLASQ